MTNKIKNKLIKEFTSIRFWLINLGFFILWLTLFLISQFYKNDNRKFIENFGFSALITALVSVLFLVFKLGFLSNVIRNFKDGRSSYKKAAEERKLNKMTPKEKEVYLKLKKEDEQKKLNQPIKTKFPFCFVLTFYSIPAIIYIIISIIQLN